MAHSMDSQATGIPEARQHRLSRDSVSHVQCTVATGSVALLVALKFFSSAPARLESSPPLCGSPYVVVSEDVWFVPVKLFLCNEAASSQY